MASRFLRPWLAGLVVAISGHHATAQEYTWTGATLNQNWDTTSANWSGSGTVWVNGANTAVFAGANTGPINVTTPITAQAIRFTANNYTITGGTITRDAGGLQLIATTGVSASIDSVIAGSVGTTFQINSNVAGNDGIIFLNGTNTYAMATQVNEGTLGGSGSLGTGAVTVASGGRLMPGDAAGSGDLSTGNSVTFQSGSTHVARLTSATTVNQLLVSGSVTYAGGVTINIDGGGGSFGTGSFVLNLGTATGSVTGLDTATFSFTNFGTLNATLNDTFVISGGAYGLNFTVTPEPATTFAAAAGLLGLTGAVRRRFRRTPVEAVA